MLISWLTGSQIYLIMITSRGKMYFMKRIFIAIDINNNKALTGLVDSYKLILKDEKIRWVDPYNMHLTLAFIGDSDGGQVEEAGNIMSLTAGRFKPFEIVFNGTGVFRNIKQPRVLWLALKVPDVLYNIQSLLSDKLEEAGLYNKEKAFKPHITLGRMRHIENRELLSDILKQTENYYLPPQSVNELILYESILKPGGPEYNPIKKIPLLSSAS